MQILYVEFILDAISGIAELIFKNYPGIYFFTKKIK